jgi:hypothetical protein
MPMGCISPRSPAKCEDSASRNGRHRESFLSKNKVMSVPAKGAEHTPMMQHQRRNADFGFCVMSLRRSPHDQVPAGLRFSVVT